jgi:hypothetical protein
MTQPPRLALLWGVQSRTMAPLKKPLFVPPPPATLDHFFTKADASSSSRTPKRRVKVGLSSSRIKHTHTPAEIIVLDSDDDDAPVVRAKRKTHAESSSSSDVEVVETEGSSSCSSGKRFRRGLGTVDVDESLHFAEFGRPKLLLIPTEHSEDEPPSAPAPSDGGSSTSTACLDNLIEIDDEWGTGDDELVRTKFDDVLELTDDDDQVVEDVLKVEEDEPPPSTSGADNILDQCPFCGRGLTKLDPLVSFPHLHIHVSRISLSSGHTITHQ